MGGSGMSGEESGPRPSGDAALFRGIIDSSPDPILAKDRQLRAVFCNDAFTRVCGKAPEELSGLTEEESGWIAEADQNGEAGSVQSYEDADREALGGTTVFIPSKRYRIDGQPRFFDITRSPIRDASGEIVAVVCAWHDVTTFHTAVEELREAGERYRAMSEYSHEWEVWQDGEGRILYMSPSFVRITGYPVPEFLSDPDLLRSIVYSEDRDAYSAHRARTLNDLRTEAEPALEFRIVRRDGGIRWIEHYCKGVFRADGSYMGRRATNRDITDTRRAEDRLKASELKFRVVFENSPLGKSLTDVDGTLHVNRAFCEITGYGQGELEEKTWREISHPDDIPASERAIEPLLKGERAVARFEKRYLHKSGKVIWADVITTLQRDKSGVPLFFITTITDITERKSAEEALRIKRLVFDRSNAANSTTDTNGIITEANNQFLLIWGYDRREEVIGRSITEYLSDRGEADAIRSSLDLRGKWWGDFTGQRKDGSTFGAHGLATVLTNAQGEVIGYQSSVIEKSER